MADVELERRIEWRLYCSMLTTRGFEEALLRWEHEGKHSAQTFPSKGQEAIAVGCCLALENGDDVIPSFRTRGAMIGMGISIVPRLCISKEIEDGSLRALTIRDARFQRKLGLIFNKDRYQSQAARAFLDLIAVKQPALTRKVAKQARPS